MPVFGGKDITALNNKVKEDREGRKGGGDKLPIFPAGTVQRMKLIEIKYETVAAKKVAGSMFHKITLLSGSATEPDKWRPIKTEFLVDATVNDKGEQGMSQAAIDVNQNMLVGFFQSSFGYDTPNAKDYNELVSFYQQHLNKPFMAAIQHQKRLYEKSADEVIEFSDPRIWYTGRVEEAAKFSMAAGVHTKPLSDKDQAILAQYKERKGLDAATGTTSTAQPIGDPDDLGDLPF